MQFKSADVAADRFPRAGVHRWRRQAVETAVGAKNQVPIRVDLHVTSVDVRRSKAASDESRNLAGSRFGGVDATQIVVSSNGPSTIEPPIATVSHVDDIWIGRVCRYRAMQIPLNPASWHVEGFEISAIQ